MNPPPKTAIATPRYPLHLVAGPWGAGKSSLINALLALRPADERWVVLLNEAGRTEVSSAAVAPTACPITVKDIVGACACCSGQVVFVSALASLIRQTRPHRVFVEVAAGAVLSDLVHAVQQSFRDSVSLETVVSLLNVDGKVGFDVTAPLIRDQWDNADRFIVHGSDPQQTTAVAELLAGGQPNRPAIIGWPDEATLGSLLQSTRLT